ncbi:MAG: RluA family pseudouridine synthase [Candidatus Hydrogenedentes bacterium]|nr:RluA family pseudouridine synthase [Candidatus Hydrogenedentota bacterium]
MPPTHRDERSELLFDVDEAHRGMRLDVFLSGAVPDATRSFLKKLIKEGRVKLNGQVSRRPSRSVALDEEVSIALPPPPSSELVPEDIPLDVLHEDADLLIVNKPSGLVVHPAPGHYTGTLVHAVLYHCANFERPTGTLSGYDADPLRPGIVHRLDRFTSGVMVVAKTQAAFDGLSKQAREHTFDRRYLALVQGEFKEDRGVIRASIGRSLSDRSRMAVTGVKSREAVTCFQVVERLGAASVVSLRLETGRTHQIRVHLRFAGRPVLGDPVYGITDYRGWPIDDNVRTKLEALEGQALHAEFLGIAHPVSGERLSFTAPAPDDFWAAQDALRTARRTDPRVSAPDA